MCSATYASNATRRDSTVALACASILSRELTMRTLCALLFLVACGRHPGPAADRPEPSREVGARCADASECEELCELDPEFPGGFCTLSCDAHADCPRGTMCMTMLDGICLYPCTDDEDCDIAGSGYVCEREN